jgi:hypothetical protein
MKNLRIIQGSKIETPVEFRRGNNNAANLRGFCGVQARPERPEL